MSTINGNPEYVPKPKSHPRRSAEAHVYAVRVRDGTGNLFDTNGTAQNGNSSPRGGVRLPTEEAKRNYAMNKGCMSEIMDGVSKNGDSAHPAKTEGFRTAESNKGEAMRTLMGKYGETDLLDRPIPKLKGENAQQYAKRNHGTLDVLFHNYGNENVPDNPIMQRVGNGSDENAKKHLGKDMGPLLRMEGEKMTHTTKIHKLHQESQNGSWDEIPPPTRIRPEAEEILARYSNTAMKEIMGMGEGNDDTSNGMMVNGTTTTTTTTNGNTNNNKNHKNHHSRSNSSSSSSSSIKSSHHKSSPRNHSGVMTERNGNFLNGYNSGAHNNPVIRGRVSPNRTKPEAMEYFNKNKHSEVGAIMRGEPLPSTPNSRKVNRNLVRSEEW